MKIIPNFIIYLQNFLRFLFHFYLFSRAINQFGGLFLNPLNCRRWGPPGSNPVIRRRAPIGWPGRCSLSPSCQHKTPWSERRFLPYRRLHCNRLVVHAADEQRPWLSSVLNPHRWGARIAGADCLHRVERRHRPCLTSPTPCRSCRPPLSPLPTSLTCPSKLLRCHRPHCRAELVEPCWPVITASPRAFVYIGAQRRAPPPCRRCPGSRPSLPLPVGSRRTVPLRPSATFPPSGPRTAGAPAEAIARRAAPLIGESAPRRRTRFPSVAWSRVAAGAVPPLCHVGARPCDAAAERPRARLPQRPAMDGSTRALLRPSKAAGPWSIPGRDQSLAQAPDLILSFSFSEMDSIFSKPSKFCTNLNISRNFQI
jgi:hypothetical protein